jgi:hypothetical protein
MYRALLAALIAAFVAGCAAQRPEEGTAPSYRYTVVVDGRISRTVTVPWGTELISVVVQPRSGESSIWQIYEATYAYVVLEPRERDLTPGGGSKLDLSGEVAYYRDLKMTKENGNDVVVHGKPTRTLDIKAKGLTLAPNAPVLVPLAEGLQVEIAVIPPDAPRPAAAP